jgi:fatty-acyl-CoA synthase
LDVNWIVDSPFDPVPVGDRTATALSIDGRESWTYEQLRDRRNRFIAVLRDADVRPGDRVGVMLLNSLDYVALYFAIARIGAIAVRVNFRLAPAELEFILGDAACAVVVFHGSRTAQLEPVHEGLAVRRWLHLPDGPEPAPIWAETLRLDGHAPEPDLPRPAGGDVLMLMYTSGTTGRPKGSVWTHDNALWFASMQATLWSYRPETVAMTTGPLYHAGGFEDLLLPALLVHGTAVMMSSAGMSADRIVDTIARGGVTNALLYPFLLYDLLHKRDLDLRDLATLRHVLSGGDPVQPWALRAVNERLPGLSLQQGYGLTEGGALSTVLDADRALDHPDSVGRPLPLTRARIVLPGGGAARPDEVGEVWVSSPAISGKYWNRPEESQETFVDGWCKTGDLGRFTPDGFLVISGRAKDMIRSGGENIYPAEVESVLAEHPDVASVAVVGVPDARYLEVGCAVVCKADPRVSDAVLEEALRSTAEQRLAHYKCPRYYSFVDELPLNSSGKVQKQALRVRFAALGSQVEEVTGR